MDRTIRLPEALDCPFCGNSHFHIEQEHFDGTNTAFIFVVCSNCLGRGPLAGSDSEAITRWNTRSKNDISNLQRKN